MNDDIKVSDIIDINDPESFTKYLNLIHQRYYDIMNLIPEKDPLKKVYDEFDKEIKDMFKETINRKETINDIILRAKKFDVFLLSILECLERAIKQLREKRNE